MNYMYWRVVFGCFALFFAVTTAFFLYAYFISDTGFIWLAGLSITGFLGTGWATIRVKYAIELVNAVPSNDKQT